MFTWEAIMIHWFHQFLVFPYLYQPTHVSTQFTFGDVLLVASLILLWRLNRYSTSGLDIYEDIYKATATISWDATELSTGFIRQLRNI